jgi:ABC-type transport system involved in multi-copper enzyme maturation permease subunit
VIDRDLFPDKLFAPAKRTDLMPDGTNPVLDKELRSEIFSQGTLMLRVVIQVSMLLSIPLMAALLFLRSDKAAYYVAYVLTFNLLVGPVFSSGSITQERERQTLSLLLTTLLGPGKIVFAKLMAALRVSTVLTFLLTEQLLLAYVLLPELRNRFWTLVVYLLIIATTCMATSTIGLMCSALARRTATAMVMTYLTLLALFVFPMGIQWYLQSFPSVTDEQLAALSVTSPFSAALSVPMHTTRSDAWINQPLAVADQVLIPITRNFRVPVYVAFLCIYPPLGFAFFGVAYLAFRWRWWRAGGLG